MKCKFLFVSSFFIQTFPGSSFSLPARVGCGTAVGSSGARTPPSSCPLASLQFLPRSVSCSWLLLVPFKPNPFPDFASVSWLPPTSAAAFLASLLPSYTSNAQILVSGSHLFVFVWSHLGTGGSDEKGSDLQHGDPSRSV